MLQDRKIYCLRGGGGGCTFQPGIVQAGAVKGLNYRAIRTRRWTARVTKRGKEEEGGEIKRVR